MQFFTRKPFFKRIQSFPIIFCSWHFLLLGHETKVVILLLKTFPILFIQIYANEAKILPFQERYDALTNTVYENDEKENTWKFNRKRILKFFSLTCDNTRPRSFKFPVFIRFKKNMSFSPVSLWNFTVLKIFSEKRKSMESGKNCRFLNQRKY